jgi:tetratricopeptide (TPR) repeat protein
MEFLKLLLLVTILFISSVSRGQYSDRVLKGFENSYLAEKESDFVRAASYLKNLYQEDSYEFNLRLGWLSYKSKQFDESAAFYRKALSLLPYSEEAKFGLILPLSAKGEWNEVITVYNQILETNPANSVALYRLGLVYSDRKDWQQALRCFQKVVDLYPFGYDGMLMLAWTDLHLGKTREAKVLFNKVLLWSPGDQSAMEGLKLLK